MHRHHQTKIQDFSGQTGYQKIPVDMALQNGKLRAWQARWTTGISPTDCQSQDTGHMDSLLRQQARTTDTRNAGPSDGNGHNFLYPKDKVSRARAKDVTYGLITCLIRPEKTNEPNQTRLVAEGDRVHCPFDAGTPTANLLTVKLLINSVISIPKARFFTNGHQEFLPIYSHDEVQVHAIKTLRHSGRRHRTLPPARHCNTRRVCLLQNLPRHVWAPASGDHCTETIGKKAEVTRLHPEGNNAWAVDTWVASNHLFSCRWQLRGKMH